MTSAQRQRKTGAERTRGWRERKRAQGLKPVTVWVLNEQDPEFRGRLEESLARWSRSGEDRDVLRENEAAHAELMAGEADYDWGPAGPPR